MKNFKVFLSDRILGPVINAHAHIYPLNNDNSPESWKACAESYLGDMGEAGFDTVISLLIQNFRKKDDFPFEQIIASSRKIDQSFPGRFFTFAGVDPRIDQKEALDLIDLAIETHGCIGIGELTCTLWGIPPHDEKLLYPYYEKVSDLGVPICIDATMQEKHSSPEIFRQIARDFPNLQICANGTGAGIGDILSAGGKRMKAWDRFLEVAEECPNLWLDLDDWQFSDQGMGAEVLIRFLRRAMDGPAKGRVMFGTDYPIPILMLKLTELQWVEKIFESMDAAGETFTQDELDMFFGKSAYSFLKTSKNFHGF